MQGSRRFASQSGMTLVEVMMVVFIIGLASSLVVLTLPGRKPASDVFADELARTLTAAQDEAILSGQPVGLVVRDGAAFLAQWRVGGWQVMPQRPITVRAGLEIALAGKATVERPDGWPVLVFDPTGVAGQANLRISSGAGEFEIVTGDDGEVQVVAF